VVLAVSGCPKNGIDSTADCPTDGQLDGKPVVLTIQGTQLRQPLQIIVGRAECSFVEPVVSAAVGTQVRLIAALRACAQARAAMRSQVTCRLPAGAGFDQNVIAIADSILSVPKKLLSYARPVTETIVGCLPNAVGSPLAGRRPCSRAQQAAPDTAIVDCARNGTDVITVTGQNFGPGVPQVLVGGRTCQNLAVLVPHKKVRRAVPHRAALCGGARLTARSQIACVAPIGTLTLRSVVLLQANGQLSLNTSDPSGGRVLLLSYFQCPPGTHEDGLACTPCALGTFSRSVGQAACLPCPYGSVGETTGMCVARPRAAWRGWLLLMRRRAGLSARRARPERTRTRRARCGERLRRCGAAALRRVTRALVLAVPLQKLHGRPLQRCRWPAQLQSLRGR
jgi:hypothetical protein